MAKATVNQITTFQLILELAPNELDLLKAMVESSMCLNESPEECQIRQAILNACNSQRT